MGPTAGGVFVVPLWSGRYLLAADGKRSRTVQPPGGVVNGVVVGPGGLLVVATAQGRDNQLVAYGPA